MGRALYLWVVVYKPGMSCIVDNVYIGNWGDSENLAGLKKNKISRVLTFNKNRRHKNTHIDYLSRAGIKYKYVEIDDKPDMPIADHFEDSIKYIKEAGGKPVLVHCSAGVSRSASIVTAYLMKEKNMSVKEALAYIKKRRSRINPNSGFINALSIYKA